METNDNKPPAHEPVLHLPPATKALAAAILVIGVIQALLPAKTGYALVGRLGFIPARFSGGIEWTADALVTPFTHMFLHGGLMHLSINLGMLLAFGAACEYMLGPRRFLVFFALSGIAAALVHFLFAMDSLSPVIGASGAISGLFGAAVMGLYYSGAMNGGSGSGGGGRTLLLFIAIWIGAAAVFGFTGMPGTDANIAWVVHIAGFLIGIVLFFPFMRHKLRNRKNSQ